MKTKMKWLAIGFVTCLIFIWVVSLIRCEILTYRHYDEFKDAYEQNTMLGDVEYFKVLKYKPSRSDIAQVYYVSEKKNSANVLTFQYNYDLDRWEQISWSTIWSTSGSASEVIYPYWWHFIYGGF